MRSPSRSLEGLGREGFEVERACHRPGSAGGGGARSRPARPASAGHRRLRGLPAAARAVARPDHRRQRPRGRGRPRRRAGARCGRLPRQAVRAARAVARIHAVMRRLESRAGDRGADAGRRARGRPCGPGARRLDGADSQLTPREFDLLALLASDPGAAVSRETDLREGLGDALVRVAEDDRRARCRAAQEARRPGLDRDRARRRLPPPQPDVAPAPAQLPDLTLIVLAVLEVPLGVTYSRNERRDLETKVERDAVTVASLSEGALEGAGEASTASLRTIARRYQRDTGGRVVVVDARGTRARGFAPDPGRHELREPPGDRVRARRAGLRPACVTRTPSDVDLLYVAVPVASAGQDPGRSADHVPDLRGRPARHRYWLTLARSPAIVLAGVSLLGLWIARGVVRPLRKLESAAAEVGAGRLDVRAPEEGPEEVRRLAHEFNETAAKLQRLLESQQAFVADASHELRTPLTALRLRLENMDPKEAGPALAEVERLGRLVESLLALARADAAAVRSEPVDVDKVLADRLAHWDGVERRGERGLRVRSSPDRLGQILDNLVANAIAVSDSVGVSVMREDGWVELHVVDHGPGLTEEERKRAFDRFWRGQGKSPGSGLGLAIVRRLADVDGGEAELLLAPGGGLDAVVRLRSGVAMPGGETTIVFLAALGTALATGLGALPLLAVRTQGARWLGAANAVASGVMLGASLSLLTEGGERNVARTAVGALAGVAFVWIIQRSLNSGGEPHVGALSGADARKALLIVGVMTAHSVAEGVGVGASFGGGNTLGIVIAIAIAIHNIPEGLAISLVLVPRGVRVRTAALWSIFSSLPQPLLAVPAYLFVEAFTSILPAALGFAAGAMVWMVATELIPEATERLPRLRVLEDGGNRVRGDVRFPDCAAPLLSAPDPFLYSDEGDAADGLCQRGPTRGVAAPAWRGTSGAPGARARHAPRGRAEDRDAPAQARPRVDPGPAGAPAARLPARGRREPDLRPVRRAGGCDRRRGAERLAAPYTRAADGAEGGDRGRERLDPGGLVQPGLARREAAARNRRAASRPAAAERVRGSLVRPERRRARRPTWRRSIPPARRSRRRGCARSSPPRSGSRATTWTSSRPG